MPTRPSFVFALSKPTYGMVWDVAYGRRACKRLDNRKTKKIWSIKESDFARLVSHYKGKSVQHSRRHQKCKNKKIVFLSDVTENVQHGKTVLKES